jgi:hypothetical protein
MNNHCVPGCSDARMYAYAIGIFYIDIYHQNSDHSKNIHQAFNYRGYLQINDF